MVGVGPPTTEFTMLEASADDEVLTRLGYQEEHDVLHPLPVFLPPGLHERGGDSGRQSDFGVGMVGMR